MSANPSANRPAARSARPALRNKINAAVASNLQAVQDALRDGRSPQEIAASLGISELHASRIVTRAVVALPNLPGAPPGSKPWSAEDDATLLRERNENGTKWGFIAWTLEREVSELTLRHAYLSRLDDRTVDMGDRVTLACMTCRNDFESWDRKRNRRCDRCKEETDGLPDAFVCFDPSVGQARRSAHSE